MTGVRPVHLADIVADARDSLPGEALHVDVATDTVVLADENRLRQVLDNLLRNARDYNDAGTIVRVGNLPDGFYVEDDGRGIERRETLFNTSISTRPGGSGFGLAIVHDIATAHSWSVTITTGTEGGARFEFTDVERVDAEE